MTNPLQAGVDHAELRRLAEAAGDGTWQVGDDLESVEWAEAPGIPLANADPESMLPTDLAQILAAYIAAANPAVMVALLNEIDALKAERDRLKLAICGGEDVPGAINAVSIEDCEVFIAEERVRAMDRPVWVGIDAASDAPEEFKRWAADFNTRAAPVLPDRGWRDIADHDKSRAPVLLVGRYRDGVTWSDVYHGWWQPEFESADEDGSNAVMMPGSWARWPHPFPPTHFQVIALPDAPAEGAE